MPLKPNRGGQNHGARKRTSTLPKALRTELEELGHIQPLRKGGMLGRKERRRADRKQAAANRAASQGQAAPGGAGKKRRVDEDDEQKKPVASTSKVKVDAKEPAKKKVRLTAPVEEEQGEEEKPAKKQTALEKLLAKQERGNGPDPERKKNRNETDEDKEIAWLEWKLKHEKGKGKEEDDLDDGLDDLFGGMDDLEGAAFGTSKKDYTKLLRENADDLDLPSDFDFDELASGSEDDFGLGGGEEGDSDDEDPFGEFGVDDDELVDAGDDDDHGEMGELGSEESDDEEAMLDESDFEGFPAQEGDEEDESGAMEMTFGGGDAAPASAAASEETAAPAAGRYIPPHLRKAAATAASSSANPASAPSLDLPPEDSRLRRQINGHLNKLSSANMSAIVDALLALYSSNPRAIVSTTLTSLLLGIISDRDNLGDQLVVTYAALVASLFRTVGIEFPAGVLAKSIEMLDAALAKSAEAEKNPSTAVAMVDGEPDFEGRPGSKECLNLVSFLAELYNFQVIHCGVVYDLVRMCIDGGLGELHVELLSKIVKRCGQSLRQDDPSALKEIITLVKQKQQGVDPATMNSRTRFMIESLTNLKNNKIKPNADGAVDYYSNLKKYLVGLNKHRASGAAPDPLRVSLSEIRNSTTRGKWWLVGAAWAGDPLAEAAAEGATGLSFQTKESQGDAELARLARKQGMNTDIRKSVFTVLMSSEDYVDACERLLQLGLSDVQQREIARVLLQCCSNEKTYNPYYTLVAHRLCTKSHSFVITLQYCLWDFLRELGEKSVGGEELVKSLQDDRSSSGASKVSDRKVTNLAKFYAWCLGKEALSIMVLKTVPFATTRDQTLSFLRQLFLYLLIATQTPSPALVLPSTATRKDREAVERVLVKAAAHAQLQRGLGYYFEAHGKDLVQFATRKMGEREGKVVKFAVKVALETLSLGGIVDL
ncbi:hypothetical protein JCM8547_007042 [Rhodosporidiobolus lusitaniae]